MTYFYIEERFEGMPMLIDKPYLSERDAIQTAMRTSRGEYRVLSFPSRDRIKVRQWWKQSIYNR